MKADLSLPQFLDGVASGAISVDEATKFLSSYGFVELGYHRLDLHRGHRTGLPEVCLGLSKSVDQLRQIVSYFVQRSLPLLVTKVDDQKAAELAQQFGALEFDPSARLLRLGRSTRAVDGKVGILTAGSSDFSVAEEAAGTLDFFGISIERAYDCGVAGLHRLFAAGELIQAADVLIVVAGMEGALPSVVGGMFPQPIIAVPTSVGYGASFEGLAALLAMMNSCAPGITVVNIDNGFGAAMAAKSILQLGRRSR